jgi:hypothetical protein
MGRGCRALGREEIDIWVIVGRPERKRPLVRPSRRWEDNIQRDLGEARGMDWIDLAQDRDQWRVILNTAMNFRFEE